MEASEIAVINRNLPSLLDSTICSARLLAILKSAKVLHDDDVERIRAQTTRMDKATLLLDILRTRTGAYINLIKAFHTTNQSGAAKILLDITEEEIANLQIEFLEKVQRVKDLLNHDQIRKLQRTLQKHVFFHECLEIRRNVIGSKIKLRLKPDCIPFIPTLYIPRYLCRRLVVNPTVFSEAFKDVFVFKGICRLQLRNFVGSNFIYQSAEQLRYKEISSKLILLDACAHWEKICCKAVVPVHLIKFESEKEAFLLEASKGGTEILQEHLNHRHNASPEFVSEDEFLKIVFTENTDSVAICDEPGMGKSLLLRSFAKNASEQYPDTIAAYIQLRELQIPSSADKTSSKVLLEHLTSTALSYAILEALIVSGKFRLALFFDGLDEVREEKLELVVDFLKSIKNTLPNSKMFITSRPALRVKLEEVIGSIAYDLQTFNYETQINYLKALWSAKHDNICSDSFSEYAKICVQKFEVMLNDTENRIAGVPLLCKIIADVFMDEALAYVESSGTLPEEELCQSSYTFADVYTMYIQRQLGITQCGFDCIRCPQATKNTCGDNCRIKNLHVRHALKLLCPKFFKRFAYRFKNFKSLNLNQMLLPSIMKQGDSLARPLEFVHRTFAEYLVAEFFSKIATLSVKLRFLQSSITLEKFTVQEIILSRESGVAYFLNSLIKEPISHKSLSVGTSSVLLSSKQVFDSILHCVCHNYDAILELIYIIQTCSRSKSYFRKVDKFLVSKEIALRILDCASRYSTAHTIIQLANFYLECYDFDLWGECSKMPKFEQTFKFVVTNAEYDIAVLFINKTEFCYAGLMKDCLEHSHLEVHAVVEKRLDISQLILTKYSDYGEGFKLLDELLETLFLPSVHIQAVNLLFRSCSFGMTDNNKYQSKYISPSTIKKLRDLIAKMCGGVVSGNVQNTWKNFQINSSCPSSLEYLKRQAPWLYLEVIEKPIIRAIEEGSVPVLDALLERNSALLETPLELTDYNCAPVLYAVRKKQMQVFGYLVSKSANLFKLCDASHNILHIAARTEECKLFHRVVEVVGEHLDHFPKQEASTCNNLPAKRPRDICQFFNWKNTVGCTPLHTVCKRFELPLETLELFLGCGRPSMTPRSVDINAKDNNGETSLYYALVYKRSLQFVKDLINCGADWNVRNRDKYNVAHICVKRSMWKHLMFFVGLGVDLNETTNENNNVLQQCLIPEIRSQQQVPLKVVKFLINAGIDLKSKNKKGETALDIAVAQVYPEEYLAELKPISAYKF